MDKGGFTVRNMGFVGTAQVITMLLSSLVLLILTRFLSPADFGLYAICLVVYNLAIPLTTMGLDSAVIHFSGEVEQAYETASTVRLILSIFAATVILILAPQLSHFFHRSNLTLAILVIVLATIMVALSFESMTRLSRNLNFKAASISKIVSSVCGSTGALLLALLGFGYLSLPLGLLFGSMGLLVALWTFQPWGIRHRINAKVARPLLRYGAYILGTSFLVLLAYNVDKLVVGKVLGNVVLGAYWMAYTYGLLMPNIFTGAVSTVMFPTFARARHDIAKMRGQYFSAMKYLAWASIPIGIGVTSVSTTFVHVLLGPSWYEVTLPLAAFSILGIIVSLTSPASSVLMATGHPDVMFKQALGVSIPYFVFLLPAVTYAGAFGISLLFVAIGVVSYSWISMYVARILQCSFLETIRPFVLPLTASILIVPICLVAQTMLGQSLLSLAVQVTLGAGSYAALMTLLTRGTFISELHYMYRRFRYRSE